MRGPLCLAPLALVLCALAAQAQSTDCPTPRAVVEANPSTSVFAELLQLASTTDAAAASPAAAEQLAPTLPGRKLLQIKPCPLVYSPVCGVDNKTYGNDCAAEAAGIKVAHVGECGSEGSGAGASNPGTVMKPCNKMMEPVCGSDGKSYNNPCLAEAAGATVVSSGYCGFIDLPVGLGNPDTPAAGLPTFCPAIFAPVCGLSNNTYSNDCMATAAQDAVVCQGECPCPDLLAALQQQGGIVFAPVDDALLPLLTNLTAEAGGSDWMQSPDVINVVLAAHVALGQGRAAPADTQVITTTSGDGMSVTGTIAPAPAGVKPETLSPGTAIRTEGAVYVTPRIVQQADGSQATYLSVQGQGQELIPVLDIIQACNFDVVLLGEPLVAA